MKDRNGNDVRIGEVIKIVGNYDIPPFNYWIVKSFQDYIVSIDVTVEHYHSKEIRFVNILDIERPFGE